MATTIIAIGTIFLNTHKLSNHHFVYITPTPIFPWLKRAYNGVLGRMIVPGGMLVFRGVATADMPTDETFTQVYPTISHSQAFFTALRTRRHLSNLIKVRTLLRHDVFVPLLINQTACRKFPHTRYTTLAISIAVMIPLKRNQAILKHVGGKDNAQTPRHVQNTPVQLSQDVLLRKQLITSVSKE